MIYTFIITITVIIFLLVNKDNSICGYPLSSWLTVHAGIYLTDFILLMYHYHYLKLHQKESIIILITRFVSDTFLVSWLIYGNVLYYKNELGNDEACGTLTLIMFLVLLIGYFEMLKCCCTGTCVIIMFPLIYMNQRRA